MDTRRVLPTANESRASPRCHELAADEDGSRRRLARDVRSLICCSIRYPSTRRGAARRGTTVTAHCGLLVWAVSSVRVSPSLAVGSYMVTRRDRRRNHSTFEGRVESARCAVPIDTGVYRFLPFAKRRGYVLSRTHAASNEVAALVLVSGIWLYLAYDGWPFRSTTNDLI